MDPITSSLVILISCYEHFEKSDSFIRNEVDDFEEWLRDKTENHEIIRADDSYKEFNQNFKHQSNSHVIETPTKEHNGFSFDQNPLHRNEHFGLSQDQNLLPVNEHSEISQDRHQLFVKENSGLSQDQNILSTNEQSGFPQHSGLYNAFEKFSNDKRFPTDTSKSSFSSQNANSEQDLKASGIFSSENKNSDSGEEIFYYRRGKADADDPLKELFKVLTQQKVGDKAKRVPRHITERHETGQTIADNHVGSCPISSVPRDDKLCTKGSKYIVGQFNSSKYAEKLYGEMLRKIPHSDEFMCSYTTYGSVNERAICPYVLNISERNPDRLPERLFFAKCSCQMSRSGNFHQTVCIELKVKVPVLWRMECQENSFKYQEGWDEIVVACVPSHFTMANSRLANNINMNGPQM
ncbi:uncharacterized protein [Parasteatoda tepidariorum]|uniref:uncharacterized protein n=1 Tax=Parasteatoda tepidariorum TaxID=114398 RepID=UPI0039BC40FA